MKRGKWGVTPFFERIFLGRLALSLTLYLSACASLQDYRVQQGDTLYAISWRYGLDYREVARWNDLKPPYVIKPGQSLTLTPPHAEWTLLSKASEPAAQAPASSQSPSNPRTQGMSASKSAPVSRSPPVAPVSKRAIHWQWPASGSVSVRKTDQRIAGVAIKGRAGQAVRAAAAGNVVYSGDSLKGYGNLVIIKHNDEFLSAYAHNRRILVSEGQRVTRGQHIADMGRDSQHEEALYFEIRKDGKPVDPRRYLPPAGR